jgi:hypothetical protein
MSESRLGSGGAIIQRKRDPRFLDYDDDVLRRDKRHELANAAGCPLAPENTSVYPVERNLLPNSLLTSEAVPSVG